MKFFVLLKTTLKYLLAITVNLVVVKRNSCCVLQDRGIIIRRAISNTRLKIAPRVTTNNILIEFNEHA